jgi:plasmid stabilization system protein ParE
MARKVIWSINAKLNYIKIIDYLIINWSQNEVQRFITRTEYIIQLIIKHPYSFKKAKSINVRRALINKQISLFYSISKRQVELLDFFDNRQNPMKAIFTNEK